MRIDSKSITDVLAEDRTLRGYVGMFLRKKERIEIEIMTPETAKIMCSEHCPNCQELIEKAEVCHLNVLVFRTGCGWDAQCTMSGETSEACRYL